MATKQARKSLNRFYSLFFIIFFAILKNSSLFLGSYFKGAEIMNTQEDIVLPQFVTDITDRFGSERLIHKGHCEELIEKVEFVAHDSKIYLCAKEDRGYTILNFYKNLAKNIVFETKGKDFIPTNTIIRFGALWPAYESITEANKGFKRGFRTQVTKQIKLVSEVMKKKLPNNAREHLDYVESTAKRIKDGYYFWDAHLGHVVEIAGLDHGHRRPLVPAYMIKGIDALRKEATVKLPEGLVSYCQNPI